MEAKEKLTDSLKKYLKPSETQVTSVFSEVENTGNDARPSCSSNTLFVPDSDRNVTQEHNIEDVDVASASTASDVDVPNSNYIVISDDPGEWPEIITSADARFLTEKGPRQVTDWIYPVDSHGRKFTPSNFYRNLANGEKVKREWLMYSTSKDAVYCFCCKLFGKSLTNLSNREGCSDWKHLSIVLSRHEKSNLHKSNIGTWSNLSTILSKGVAINQSQLRLLDVEKKYWYRIIERIISAIQFLCRQCLALRGSSSKLYENNNGNFLKLIETFSKFDSVMEEHVRRTHKNQSSDIISRNYLGDKIQNELIDLIGLKVKNTILDLVRKYKYYSIILDCTPDVSHTEQLSVILRFVLLNELTKKIEIREHFIEFCPITDSTGAGLCNYVTDLLLKLNLSIHDLRGQGYDNGANMRGIHSGLQTRILNINPRAYFVPCSAHSLNLVVNDAAKISFEVSGFFDIVQEIYVFFSASTKRWSVLKTCISDLTLKPLSDTRWSSRIDAIKPLRYQIGQVYVALLKVMEASASSKDFSASHLARSLATKIQNYNFLCSVIIWYNTLFKINSLSKLMQNKSINLKVCLDCLNKIKTYLTDLRSDKGFNEILVDARELAEELEIEPNFASIQTVRLRKKKKQFDYESNDEPIIDPKINYKVNVFFSILDTTLSSLDERFKELKRFNNIFGFIYKMFRLTQEELRISCENLSFHLKDESRKESDIDANDLFDEINCLKCHMPESTGENDLDPQVILQYILENQLISTFPNIAVTIRIFLTLPVSVASGERSFSKLKLIKTYLRSSMAQERLSYLAIMSIESEIMDSISLDELIKDFAEKKARKECFQ